MSDLRKRRREKNRQTILTATIELVAKKGASNVSIREIAHQADYSPAALYKYFDTKEAIFAAVSSEGFRLLDQHLRQVADELSTDAHLIEFGLAYLVFARRHPQHYLLMFADISGAIENFDRDVDDRDTLQFFINIVQSAQDKGVLRKDMIVGELLYSIWAVIHGMAMLQIVHMRENQESLAARDRVVIEMLFSGLMS